MHPGDECIDLREGRTETYSDRARDRREAGAQGPWLIGGGSAAAAAGVVMILLARARRRRWNEATPELALAHPEQLATGRSDPMLAALHRDVVERVGRHGRSHSLTLRARHLYAERLAQGWARREEAARLLAVQQAEASSRRPRSSSGGRVAPDR